MRPSYEDDWHKNQRLKPKIQVLEIRDRKNLVGGSIAWLLVERQESDRFNKNNGLLGNTSIHISYREITPRHAYRETANGEFCGSYHEDRNTISLTSTSLHNGAVFIDPPWIQGNRLGTYLMNEIVQWAKRWPEATVNSINLIDGQGNGENKERRNKFYEQFGLVFNYYDLNRRAGISLPMFVSELTLVDTWKNNIVEHRLFDYFAEILFTHQRDASELASRNHACRELIAERRSAETKPLRWAFKIMYSKYERIVICVAVIAALVMLGWMRLRS